MPVAGLRGTGSWGTDERPKSFRETVLRWNPNGTAPILALTSKAKKRTVRDPEFSWWGEGNDIVRLQVNGALAGADTLITVDSPDPTDAAPGRNYGKATHLKSGDLLLVEPAADNATFNHEIIEVVTVISDTQFTANRGVGGTSAANISNDAYLTLYSSAYAEGTGIPEPAARNPIKFRNYTQIFKDTYEITGTADVTEVRTGPAYAGDKRKKAWDHAQKIEWSILFGRPYETTGSNGQPKRFMGGLRNYVANVTVFGSAVTKASFFDAVAPVFNFSTGAGDTRMIFGGNDALMALQTVFDSAFTRQIGATSKVYGMDLTEFILPMGRVLFRTHPLMSRHGLYKKSAFVVDFDALSYVTLPGRDTKPHDDVQAKDEDVRRGFYQTECSIEVGYGGLTMAYLGNISAT